MEQAIATTAVWSSVFMWAILSQRLEGPIGFGIALHLAAAVIATGFIWMWD